MTSIFSGSSARGWVFRLVAGASLIVLFLIANRAAYKGYFSSDDLDNIAWTRNGSARMFAEGLATPFYMPQHFRPPGHFLFYALGGEVGLNYPWYVAVVHAAHFLNVLLVYLLLRRLGLGVWGALFFAFPMAAFEALWKPMYIFDVLCGTFVALTLLEYVSGRTILALVCCWLAYKSKENGVMVAFAVVAYEYWIGGRNWKRTMPFVAVALWFMGQAVLANRGEAGGEYELKLTAEAVWTTVSFYGRRALLSGWALAALVCAAAYLRDRRAAFGLTAAVLLLGPLLLLPGRLYGAYLYVPMIGLSVAVGTLWDRIGKRPIAAAVAMMIWWGVNFQVMRLERNPTLAEADLNRVYVAKVMRAAQEHPDAQHFLYDGSPSGMHWWGIEGALRLAYQRNEVELKQAHQGANAERTLVLSWNEGLRILETAYRDGSTALRPAVRMSQTVSVFQLDGGWHPKEGDARWSEPLAKVRLWRPAGARFFEMEAAAPERATVEVRVDGAPIGKAEMEESVWRDLRIPVAETKEGPVTVELRVTPPHHPGHGDTRVLGVLVRRLGFSMEDGR
ncbi:MAG: hypothetical protein R2762_00145 [Bryobacteraceae bacterium]